jgi:hypothetical protein
MTSEPVKYMLEYYFEWFGGCLWAANEASREVFGLGPLDKPESSLPLSSETLQACHNLGQWHDTALNQDCPPDPGPWRKEECDRFNEAAQQLLRTIREELRERFEIIDKQLPEVEDPDLDVYLLAPKDFRRKIG